VNHAGGILAFERRLGANRFLVVLNLRSESAELPLDSSDWDGAIALGTVPGREGEAVARRVALRPDEGVIICCTG